MIMPPDASILWTWVYITLGLALVPLWWRALLQKDLEVDRSLRPEDVQVTDGVMLQERDGLLLALRQHAQHMRIVYGMEVAVEPRGVHQVEEEQRMLLFEVVQELLLYLAGRDCHGGGRIALGRADGYMWSRSSRRGNASISAGRRSGRAGYGRSPTICSSTSTSACGTSVGTCGSSRTGAAPGESFWRPGSSWRMRRSSGLRQPAHRAHSNPGRRRGNVGF
jgi:hypothetical protein